MAKYSIVKQYDQIDCAPASLLSILKHYGGDSTLPHLRELCKTNVQGSTMLDLVEAAKQLGFEAFGASGEYEDLMKEEMPCIAHVVVDEVLNHFVVVYEINEKDVTIGDPGKGVYKLNKEEFLKIWKTKSVVLLKPGKKLYTKKSPGWVKWISTYLKKEEVWLYQSIFLGVLYTALGLLTSFFVQKLIDEYIPDENLERTIYTGLFLLLVLLVRGFAGYFRERFLVILNKRVNLNINSDFLEHLFKLPKKFFDTRKKGDITARIHDAMRIQQAAVQLTGITVIDSLIIIGSFIFLFQFSTLMALISLAAIPLYGLILVFSIRKIKFHQNNVMKGFAQVESTYIDTLGGIDDILGYGSSNTYTMLNKFFFKGFQEESEKLGFVRSKLMLLAESSGSIITIGMLIFGAWWVISGELLLGKMMAAYSLLVGMLPAVNRLVNANIYWQEASVAATRLMDMLLVETEDDKGKENFKLEEKLEIKEGAFSWDGRNNFFENLNLEIPKGRITSLWGPSGSGKSTLVQILQQKYKLNKGELLSDDNLCNLFNLETYRKSIGVVPQLIKIFNGTLADNILVGREVKDVNELQLKIEETGLASFVNRFEQGLFTILGEENRQLSGGEMQVLALIRALLEKPEVLIIDEGLSGIDMELEEMIFRVVKDYAENKAVFLITHNITSLLKTDYIYILKEKRIIEKGSPEELIEDKGYFFSLLEIQNKIYSSKELV